MTKGPDNETTGRIICAASENSADMLYACGVIFPDPVIWFSGPDKTILAVSSLELGRAQKQARKGTTVMSRKMACRYCGLDTDPAPANHKLIAAMARKAEVSTLEVPGDFPLSLAGRLEEEGLTLTPVEPYFPERARKSPDEVELVAQGVELAEAGLEQALKILRESSVDPRGKLKWQSQTLTSEILRGEIDAQIAKLGGTASHTIAAPGRQGADPHIVGNGPMMARQPIIMDIFPRVDSTGYYGDLTRTVVKGPAPEKVRRAFDAVRAAQTAAINKIRPGVSCSEAHEAANAALRKAGFETDADADPPYGFFHGTGHGVGLEIHERPRLSKCDGTALEEGNVVTVEPGLYYPEWGGIRLEDVVAVTREGCRNLTTAKIFLEIPL